MDGIKLVLEGEAVAVVLLILAVGAFVLVGSAVTGVIDARRRAAQRDRELVVLEAFHALRYPRPAVRESAAGDGTAGCGACRPGTRPREGERC